jgi:hypothetical protein
MSRAGETGSLVRDWTTIDTAISSTGYTTDWSVDFSSLTAGFNYITVRALDFAGNTTTFIDAFYIKKDTTAPQITVGSGLTGGDTSYRNASGNFYDVDFEATIASQPNLPGGEGDLKSWSIPAEVPQTPLDESSFTTDWTIDFSALQEGVTNYISVRVWNIVGTTTTLEDAFLVFVDVTPPIVDDPVSGDDTVWRSTSNAYYNVNFTDSGGSQLFKFQTRITTGPSQTGTLIQDWTTQLEDLNTNSYASDC